MQIVIDIPDDFYKGIKLVADESDDISEETVTIPMEVIINGITLPEDHGRLVDADYLKEDMLRYGWHHVDCTVSEYVEDMLPTILEST